MLHLLAAPAARRCARALGVGRLSALVLALVLLAAGCGQGGGRDRRSTPPAQGHGPGQRGGPPVSVRRAPRRSAPAPRPVLITHGPRSRKWVALTFDADMTEQMLARLRGGRVRAWYDPAIVAELRATGTPATVFLTGLWTSAYPDVVRSLARDPLFELENHSVDHAAFQQPCFGLPSAGSPAAKRREVTGAAEEIQRVAGVRPSYFRFPGGCYDAGDLQIVRDAGEQAVGWDVVSGDPFEPDPAKVEANVLAHVQPGSIVVLHLIGAPNAPATATALRTIIPTLRARGYRFVTLRQLLG